MSRSKHSELNRRDFLYRSCLTVAGVGAGGIVSLGSSCSTSDKSPQPSAEHKSPFAKTPEQKIKPIGPTVVSMSDPRVFGAQGHDKERVKQLTFKAIADLVGVKNPAEAFRALFKPDDVVAIKLNCLAGPGLSSSVSVVDALVAGLRSIGIENKNIIIWERTSAELAKAGFETNRYSGDRPRCLGNDEAGFSNDIEFSGEIGSLFTNVLAKKATALINVPVMKDHDLSGVGCGMKNMFGAIHNPNRYHENNCDPFVADVSAHPFIKVKLRLILADALTAQYHGGPARAPAYQWRPDKILAAVDPVALDRIAQKMIDEKRAEKGMASLKESNRPPKWLETAALKHKLGENKLEKIRLKEG
jgi:uncharacterized protein (DUF362 family)